MSAARKAKQQEARSFDELGKEIKRIDAMLKKLSDQLNDPEIELSTMMRLTVSRNELMVYLRGIRYALGEEEPFDPVGESSSKN
jgi:hypothetical protein